MSEQTTTCPDCGAAEDSSRRHPAFVVWQCGSWKKHDGREFQSNACFTTAKSQQADQKDAKPCPTPLQSQVGGSHYKDMKIQPVEFIHANGIGYFEGCAIKYLSRWKVKGGVEDLKKAKHFIELLIALTETHSQPGI